MTPTSLNLEQRGFEYGVKHLLSPVRASLVDVLTSELALSASEIQDLLYLGAIYIQSSRAQTSDLEKTFEAGTYMRVHTKPRRFPGNDFPWDELLLFENEDFIVINKPSALPCHPSVDNTQENLLVYLQEHFKRSFLLTHRLDVPTNGLLVLAKTTEFQSLFNSLLQQRQLQKIYRATCTGQKPRTGLYRHFMEPSPRAPKKVSAEAHPGHAVCELEVLACDQTNPDEFDIRIRLLTGRTHQIRAQLSVEGSPIRGDHMYGAAKIYTDDRIDLTACKLEFTDPRKDRSYCFVL